MKNFLWWVILWTTLAITWCKDTNNRKHLEHSYAEKSKYSWKLTDKEKLSLIQDHVQVSNINFTPYELETELDCTKEHNSFNTEWNVLDKVTINIEWDWWKEDQIIRELIEENLQMYKSSIFREHLTIEVLTEKTYKERKIPWLALMRDWTKNKKVMFINKKAFTTLTLHHELAHFFQYQISSDLDFVNVAVWNVNNRVLETLSVWDNSKFFVSDYSTKSLAEDVATIHESLINNEMKFIKKAIEHKWLREKIEVIYGAKIDESHLLNHWNYSMFWHKPIKFSWELNEKSYMKMSGVKKWSNIWWLSMYKELNYNVLNQVQKIKMKIWNCVSELVSEKSERERIKMEESWEIKRRNFRKY